MKFKVTLFEKELRSLDVIVEAPDNEKAKQTAEEAVFSQGAEGFEDDWERHDGEHIDTHADPADDDEEPHFDYEEYKDDIAASNDYD